MENILIITTIIVLITSAIHYYRNKKQTEYLVSLVDNHRSSSEEIKRTLAMGLYMRFKSKEENEKFTQSFIRQDPYQFEEFVARLLAHKYGAIDYYVSQGSGDYGVDVELDMPDGSTIYGQVKCYKDDLSYSPIALVHSNAQKHGAKRAFVVTTSNYSKKAKAYADGIDVDLYNGIDLVEAWFATLESSHEEITSFVPQKPIP